MQFTSATSSGCDRGCYRLTYFLKSRYVWCVEKLGQMTSERASVRVESGSMRPRKRGTALTYFLQSRRTYIRWRQSASVWRHRSPVMCARGETRSDDVSARIGPSRDWVDAPKKARDRFDLFLRVPYWIQSSSYNSRCLHPPYRVVLAEIDILNVKARCLLSLVYPVMIVVV